MIRYIIEKHGKLDFSNPIDAENPFSFDLKVLSPSTDIYLVDYDKKNDEIVVNFSIKKPCLVVVKSIINLYPDLIFTLHISFWQDDDCRTTLLKTGLRTVARRSELSSANKDGVEKFKNRCLQFLNDNNLGDKHGI